MRVLLVCEKFLHCICFLPLWKIKNGKEEKNLEFGLWADGKVVSASLYKMSEYITGLNNVYTAWSLCCCVLREGGLRSRYSALS